MRGNKDFEKTFQFAKISLLKMLCVRKGLYAGKIQRADC